MNHLAHLFLSGDNVQIMVGNFIADHVKGKEVNNYPKEIRQGIEMHRAIDYFTDYHSIVKQSKRRLYPKYHKYAAVIVDMFYDHILANNWANYSPLPLQSYTQWVYRVLDSHKDLFNEKTYRTFLHMKTHNWLLNYKHLEGMQKAMNGLSNRTSFVSRMDESISDLEKDYFLYKAEFEPFFYELVLFCKQWSIDNK